jgi:putative tryptophan/tyrosine transport system substrate-binding protein
MRRRDVLRLLGGTAVSWPLTAVAQQPQRMRRVGILMPFSQSDTAAQTRVRAFREELQGLGWSEGRNLQFDERWTADEMDRVRSNAVSLLELKPDVVVAAGGRVAPILKQMSRSVPMVIITADPVGAGIVDSLARPGGNITGFSLYEFSLIGKSVEMLKKVAPNLLRVALLYNSDNPTTAFFVRSFEASAGPLAIEPIIVPVHGVSNIDQVVASLSKQQDVGIVFPPDVTIVALREQIVAAIARHRLAAIFSDRALVRSGGLMSYSTDLTDIFRQTASYVDRILRGEQPGNLPVQEPTKYILTINLKTAQSLGLEIPVTLLALADEVIE